MSSTFLKPGPEMISRGPRETMLKSVPIEKSLASLVPALRITSDLFIYYWEASKELIRVLHLVIHINPALEMQQHCWH